MGSLHVRAVERVMAGMPGSSSFTVGRSSRFLANQTAPPAIIKMKSKNIPAPPLCLFFIQRILAPIPVIYKVASRVTCRGGRKKAACLGSLGFLDNTVKPTNKPARFGRRKVFLGGQSPVE